MLLQDPAQTFCHRTCGFAMPCHVRKRNSRNMPLAAHRHVVDVASAGGVPERRAANPTKQTGKLNRMSRLAVPTPQLETRKPRNTLPGFAHCVATPLRLFPAVAQVRPLLSPSVL